MRKTAGVKVLGKESVKNGTHSELLYATTDTQQICIEKERLESHEGGERSRVREERGEWYERAESEVV